MPRTATGHPALYAATYQGLHAEPKELPTVWLYDDRGSQLYERITRLPEYYLPLREGEILSARADEIAKRGRATTLVELGAGTSKNTRLLLDKLDVERFAPLDVSERTLRASAQAIADAYPRVRVEPVVGDFEHDFDALPQGGRRLIAFLGSTIGNLDPEQRSRFLATLAGVLEQDDAFLVGLDLVKDVARVEAAYNDSGGVTEAFVRNSLTAVNRELEATFDQRRFVYEARWDANHEWMDIGLRAKEAHTVSIHVSRARRRIRGGRAASRRGQLEVQARAVRARGRTGRASARIVVDRPCGRLRARLDTS